MNKIDYVTNNGIFCPVCGENSVDGGAIIYETDVEAFQACQCTECVAEWEAVYFILEDGSLELHDYDKVGDWG